MQQWAQHEQLIRETTAAQRNQTTKVRRNVAINRFAAALLTLLSRI